VRTILKCRFGSHLYGTNTKDSDEDYKGIALSDSNEILLGNIFKTKKESTGNDHSKNTKDDLDYDIYSLHYFIKLACEGETAAIDMLHVPDNMILEASDEWKFIQAHREKFYTKNMKAFVGYARRQAAKYGCRGSRLKTISEAIQILDICLGNKYSKMCEVWDILPIGDHARFIEDSPNGAKQYQICGRILQSTARIQYSQETLISFHDRYGERSKLAEKNEGIDWKAISHAIRAAEQLIELFIMNTVTFPRPEADYLKAVKSGKLDYRKEVEPYLNDVMDRVEKLGAVSHLPGKADINFWNNFLIEICKKQIINS
jgi:hypothetical protein